MHLYVVKHNPKTFVVGEKTVILSRHMAELKKTQKA